PPRPRRGTARCESGPRGRGSTRARRSGRRPGSSPRTRKRSRVRRLRIAFQRPVTRIRPPSQQLRRILARPWPIRSRNPTISSCDSTATLTNGWFTSPCERPAVLPPAAASPPGRKIVREDLPIPEAELPQRRQARVDFHIHSYASNVTDYYA